MDFYLNKSLKPRPDLGHDSLICTEFARQRHVFSHAIRDSGFHIETLTIDKLSSRRFTTHNGIYESYANKRVVIWIETNFMDYECLHIRVGSVGS